MHVRRWSSRDGVTIFAGHASDEVQKGSRVVKKLNAIETAVFSVRMHRPNLA